jgi:hypothetical protein
MTRNLVFSSVGDRTAHRHWISGAGRNFDLILTYYGSEENEFSRDAKVFRKRKGTKIENFVHLYRTEPGIIEKYDTFFIVDDDIIIDTSTINAMFDLFKKYDLSLAQPAYSPGSHIRWPITSQDSTAVLRYTNFVEVGVPVLTRAALDLIIDAMEMSSSGWGLDMLFSQLLGDPKDRIAILDSTPCLHPRRQVPEMDNVMTRAKMKEEGLELLRHFRGGEFLEPKTWGMIQL